MGLGWRPLPVPPSPALVPLFGQRFVPRSSDRRRRQGRALAGRYRQGRGIRVGEAADGGDPRGRGGGGASRECAFVFGRVRGRDACALGAGVGGVCESVRASGRRRGRAVGGGGDGGGGDGGGGGAVRGAGWDGDQGSWGEEESAAGLGCGSGWHTAVEP